MARHLDIKIKDKINNVQPLLIKHKFIPTKLKTVSDNIRISNKIVICNELQFSDRIIYNIKTSSGFKAFNNSIIKFNNNIIMVYRYARGKKGISYSEIKICNINTIDNNKTILTYAEDPRFFIYKNELFIAYTKFKRHSIKPTMCIAKLNNDLDVVNIYEFNNSKTEKNWVFFECNEILYCIYHYNPLTIYKFNNFKIENIETFDNLIWNYGEIRGSTSPIILNDKYITMFHSSIDGRYYVGIIKFIMPFKIIEFSKTPMKIDIGEVIFPCSMNIIDEKIVVGYGFNDCECRSVVISEL